jgi:hypothetical protein
MDFGVQENIGDDRTRMSSIRLPVGIFVIGNGTINTAITTFGASDMVLHMPYCIDLLDGEPGAARGDRLSRMFCCLIDVCQRLGTKSGKNHFTYFEWCLLCIAISCGGALWPNLCAISCSPSHALRCQRLSCVRAEQKGAVAKYGWIGQQPSSGFCDLTPATLGVFASLDRF